MSDLALFTYYRTNEVIKSGSTVVGNRGILSVNGKEYFTIERDISRYVNVPQGLFTLKMEYSPTKKVNGETRKQFRIMGHNVNRQGGGLANLLIHRGKSPGTLTGCIAPGKDKTTTGITQSDEAIEELFEICGGFKDKTTAATLSVVSGPITYHFGATNYSESTTGNMFDLSEALNF